MKLRNHSKKFFLLLFFLLFSIQNVSLSKTNKINQANVKNNIDFQDIRNETNKEFNKNYQTKDIKEYEEWRLNFIKKSYEWQFYSSIGIYFLVVFILFTGLYFSYLQFKNSIIKQNINNNNKDSKNTKSLPETKLKLSQTGVEVSSSLIGVIILVFSVIFFYMYIEKIYPLKAFDENKLIEKEINN